MMCLFVVRSFSLGQTVTRMSALAVIQTPRRTRTKPSTYKEEEDQEPEEEFSKAERWKRLHLCLTQSNHSIHTTTNKIYSIFNICNAKIVIEVRLHTLKGIFTVTVSIIVLKFWFLPAQIQPNIHRWIVYIVFFSCSEVTGSPYICGIWA